MYSKTNRFFLAQVSWDILVTNLHLLMNCSWICLQKIIVPVGLEKRILISLFLLVNSSPSGLQNQQQCTY